MRRVLFDEGANVAGSTCDAALRAFVSPHCSVAHAALGTAKKPFDAIGAQARFDPAPCLALTASLISHRYKRRASWRARRDINATIASPVSALPALRFAQLDVVTNRIVADAVIDERVEFARKLIGE